ncbi:MAG: response regulator [Rhizobacter sp.]|nr:response regulator [Chlorobiales bacterium]
MQTEKLQILFVDDEPMILLSLKQTFDTTYKVHTAISGAEAIEFVKATPEIAIVVSDQRMPGMKGIEVLKAIRHLAPHTVRMLLTGYADAEAVFESVNVGEIFRYLKKPWRTDDLRQTFRLAEETYLKRRQSVSLLNAAAQASPDLRQAVEHNSLPGLRTDVDSGGAVLPPEAKPSILIVDDDPMILESFRQLFANDYDVITVSSAEQAMQVLESNTFVALVMTDQRMPKKTGTDLIIESKHLAPLTPKILITAYSDVEDVIRLINEGQIYRYLQKPWTAQQIRQVVGEAVQLFKRQLLMAQVSEQKAAKASDVLKTADTVDTSTTHTSTKPPAKSLLSPLEALKALNSLANKK